MAYDPRPNSCHHLNFQPEHLNFTADQFKTLHSSFRFHIIGKCFCTRLFGFLTQLLYLTLLAVYFQLACQIT